MKETRVKDHQPGCDRRGFFRRVLGAGAGASLLGGLGSACATRVPVCKSVPPNLFVEGGRPLLVSVEGEDLAAMIKAGLEALGGLDKLRGLDRKAILKGSFVAPQPYPVSTPADLIIELSKAMKGEGFERTTLFEAHGTRLVPALAPEAFMRRVGVFDEVQRHGVEVLAADFFERDDFKLVRNPAWPIPSPVAVHRVIDEAPVLVSLPPVKRHGSARFTSSLKIHFGSVSMADRMVAHKNERTATYFDERLVHFADAAKPQLNVVDARMLLARNGPALSSGSEIVRGVNRIVLCGDMVASDAYCAKLLARHDPTFSVEMIDHQLKHATQLGLGTADLDAVKVVELRV
jgi:uncharacterized protein (DUF362 family)